MENYRIENIQPIHNTNCSCYEDIIITSADYYGEGYHHMFQNSWDFEFPEEVEGLETASDLFSDGDNMIVSLLQKYYGLKYVTKEAAPRELMADVFEKIRTDDPVVLYINSFYCTWHSAYHSETFAHLCIAFGYDNNNKCFIVLDPYTNEKVNQLLFEDFMEGVKGIGSFLPRHTTAHITSSGEYLANLKEVTAGFMSI